MAAHGSTAARTGRCPAGLRRRDPAHRDLCHRSAAARSYAEARPIQGSGEAAAACRPSSAPTAPPCRLLPVWRPGGTATILGAYYFQYGWAGRPWPLCLEERIPLIVDPARPLSDPRRCARAAQPGAGRGSQSSWWRCWIVAGEHLSRRRRMEVWPARPDCIGPVTGFGMPAVCWRAWRRTVVVRCDEAAWRLFGISLAGYDVFVISLGLPAVGAAVILDAEEA